MVNRQGEMFRLWLNMTTGRGLSPSLPHLLPKMMINGAAEKSSSPTTGNRIVATSK
jgi:hypothetical protein